MSWRIEERELCWAIIDSSGRPVTHIDKAPAFYQGEPCGSITSRGRTEDELYAIACMIAAAPGMYDALHQWQYADGTGDSEELANARASRDKALNAGTA